MPTKSDISYRGKHAARRNRTQNRNWLSVSGRVRQPNTRSQTARLATTADRGDGSISKAMLGSNQPVQIDADCQKRQAADAMPGTSNGSSRFRWAAAKSVLDGLAQIKLSAPEYAVVDMRLGDGCGLDVISALKHQRPDARAIILTGYGNIATAVRAANSAPWIISRNLQTLTTLSTRCWRERAVKLRCRRIPCRRPACV